MNTCGRATCAVDDGVKAIRRSTRRFLSAVLGMTAVLLLTSAAASLAQPAARDAERERRIEQQLRLISPEAVPAFRAATGLFDGFRQPPFCAVLAHEYGHFAHRDTAGGDVALRVNQDMAKSAVALIQSGQAVWWNLAWYFLCVYSFLFRRISHGATRLQEVLADRVAARHYGGQNFEEGLRHVVRRHVAFTAALNAEVQQAIETRRTIRNLFDAPLTRSSLLEREIEDAILRPSSEDDTHPGPAERFRLLSGVIGITNESIPHGMVWDLFANRDQLAAEMTARIEAHVREMRA